MNTGRHPFPNPVAIFLFAFVALLLVICYPSIHRAKNAAITQKIFGTADVRTVFATAESVTVQRLHSHEPPMNYYLPEEYLHGPQISVPADTLRQLRQLFQQSGSFPWSSGAKACLPNFGVLFTFHTKSRDVRLALCFECNIFAIYDGASHMNTEENFDPMAAQLAALVKTLFPNDPEIQSLK